MKFNAALVLTTIFESEILDVYWKNFQRYGHLDRVKVFVIPDRKTPQSVYTGAAAFRERGLNVVCPTLEEQEAYLSKLGMLPSLVPFNSDNRRNVGFLMALESGIDFMASIDDDNFCLPDSDFLTEHSVVCGPSSEITLTESKSGWINICEMLDLEPANKVFPRGFPYCRRQPNDLSTHQETGLIRMNAGLWLAEPDLDATTWLAAPVKATAMNRESIVLSGTTWSPINTQNTGIHRDAIAAYYYFPMGYAMGGVSIDRYGDIFSGYFVQSCLRHMGHRIRVGSPLAEHRRNSHNFIRDCTQEMPCAWLLEDLAPWLREVKLSGSNYFDTYDALSMALEDAVERFQGSLWNDTTRGYFHRAAYCMREWVKACRRIG